MCGAGKCRFSPNRKKRFPVSYQLAEAKTHDIHAETIDQAVLMLDRLVHPGDTLCVVADAVGTETVAGVIYETGG